MPVPNTQSSTAAEATQLQNTIASFTSLTDPLAINDALLVLQHALQGPNATGATHQILSSIPFSHFFQLLQEDYGEDTELTVDRTCSVIESLLRDQPYLALVQDPLMQGALLQSLSSPVPRIHALGLSQVEKVNNEQLSVVRAMVSQLDMEHKESALETDIFRATVEGLTSETISIAERSKQALMTICSTDERLQTVIHFDGSFRLIQDLSNSKNSIVWLRMADLLTTLAGRSREALLALEKTRLFDSLKDELGVADSLTRFNLIEILSEFGSTEPGSEYLDHSGILKRLEDMVRLEAEQDILGTNGIIKLYGKLGSSEQVDFIALDMKYRILSQLEWLLVGDDEFSPPESLQVEAMASIGLIGGNLRNTAWVCESSCASTLVARWSVLRRETKVAWYHSLAQIVACSPDPSPETERVVAAFYSQLEGPGQSPFITRLLVSAKSQTVELALSALALMIPLARYPFAVQKMGAQRDAIAFLLDRNAELSHSEKVARFEVVDAMLKTHYQANRTSDTALLADDQVSRLDLFRRQGPFYQRATATVAIQDIAA
ncbi:26S proteasome non-ATPase regulatory subunit 5 [Mortierella claussenii]|nr:26S proteasome non-ATPase regulatory subunit 5 [Mortierella claussenii]